MPRKPVHLELAGGKSKRQRICEAICKKGDKEFDRLDVTPGDVHDDITREYLTGLVNAGYLSITRQSKDRRVRTLYKRTEKPAGAETPRVRKDGKEVTQGKGNEAIWGAMQALGTFTYRLLAEMSGATEQTVKAYCLPLARAGYLITDQESKKKGYGSTQAKFRLIKSKVSGPRPPMITRLKAVYDPNVHKIVWQEGADEAAEAMA